jgi:hypothetical protein
VDDKDEQEVFNEDKDETHFEEEDQIKKKKYYQGNGVMKFCYDQVKADPECDIGHKLSK